MSLVKKYIIALLFITIYIPACFSMESLKASLKIAALPVLASMTPHIVGTFLQNSATQSTASLSSILFHSLKMNIIPAFVSGLLVAGASRIGTWPQLNFTDISNPLKKMLGTTIFISALIGIAQYNQEYDEIMFQKALRLEHKLYHLSEKQKCALLGTLASLCLQSQVIVPLGSTALSLYILGTRYSMS